MIIVEDCKPEGLCRRFRRILAQFLAVTIKNLLLCEAGLNLAFSGIVIPSLSGAYRNEFNKNETLSLNAVQASWLGSMVACLQPIGCIFSGLLTDPLGRRRTMLISNIPFFIAWFMLYRAGSIEEIFAACALLGFSVGLMEAPIVTYIGEITEASVRGVMLAYSSLTFTIGILFVNTLNTLMPWRTVALVCMFVPISAIIALLFVPETPMWLLSKNRTDAAEKSLQWLRGWVPKSAVAKELQELQRYSKRSKSCADCIKQNENCPHPLPTLREKFHDLWKSQTMKPFFIAITAFFINQFSGMIAMMPYNVQIFKAYDSPIAPDRTVALLSVVSNFGMLSFLILLRFTGKRPLYLTMLGSVAVCTAILSAYGFILLPSDYNSFDHTKYFAMKNKQLTYIPFACIIVWNFCTNCGINSVAWLILSEVFPYRTRGLASAIAGGLNYIFCFISIKTYFNLESVLSLPGVTLFYCTVVTIGGILMYNILPETEGRTLEDIELHFSDKTKKLNDHKIPKRKKVPIVEF